MAIRSLLWTAVAKGIEDGNVSDEEKVVLPEEKLVDLVDSSLFLRSVFSSSFLGRA